jgi:hypothetical protein
MEHLNNSVFSGEEKEAEKGRKGKIATNAHFVPDEALARSG